MRKHSLAVSILISSLLLLADSFWVISAQGPSSPDLRNTWLKNVHFSDATLLEVLGELAVQYRIPIGFEVSADDRNEKRLSLDLDAGSLEQVLDSLARQVPQYTWHIKDGVVNFQPKKLDRDFLETLLDTHISHFTVPKDASKFGIRDAILDLPEVRRLLEDSHMKVSRFDYFVYPSIYSKEVDLSTSATDVRGVLNKVVRESEHKMWVLRLKGEKKDSMEVGF